MISDSNAISTTVDLLTIVATIVIVTHGVRYYGTIRRLDMTRSANLVLVGVVAIALLAAVDLATMHLAPMLVSAERGAAFLSLLRTEVGRLVLLPGFGAIGAGIVCLCISTPRLARLGADIQGTNASLRAALDESNKALAERQLAEALYHSEMRFRDIVEATSERIWETDATLRFTFVSEAPGVPVVHSAEAMIGKTPWEVVGVDTDRDEQWGWLRAQFEARQAFRDFHATMRSPDGDTRHVRVGGAPYFDKTGSFCGYRGVTADETEEQHRAAELRNSEIKYRTLFENVPDGLFRSTRDGEFLSANPAMVAMLGYDSEEALRSINTRELYEIPAERDAMIRRLDRDGEVRGAEISIRRRDGQCFHALFDIHGGRDEHGRIRYLDGTLRDISERKRAEQALREHQARLRQLASELAFAEERVRRDTAADLHDGLAQSLFIGRMKLHTLQERADESQAALIGDIVSIVEDAISRTRTMITELSPPVLYDLGLEAAIRWLGDHMVKAHGLVCHLEIQGEHMTPSADLSVLLFKAVRELLLNVAKHAGVVEVLVTLVYRPGVVSLTVEDAGAGFAPGRAGQTPGVNHGFGLFSIGERVTALGGSFDVQSLPGRGTRATLRLPVSVDDADSGSDTRARPPSAVRVDQ